ncbi:hypothetical protein [Elizabethkingia occulta]|uniref:hypothetical protein n=2 Tax=Elizabethkingia occulta TaxID=1867263 RepID=UPI001FE9CE5D|nr:hypothetical protein [Elizabethkingia occulta]
MENLKMNNMLLKKVINISFTFLLISCAKSQNSNYICNDCGSFDLSKISFNENIDQLTSKTEVFKTVFVNEGCEEKRMEDILKSDNVCAFKYNLYETPKNKIHLSFSDKLKFNNLHLLADSKKELVAYSSSEDFNGSEKDFTSFVDFLTKKLNTKPQYNILLLDETIVYQWDTNSYIYQFTRSKNKQQKEVVINGKTIMDSYYYVTFSVYQKDKLNSKIKSIIPRNENFIIYNDKYFKK